MLSLTVMDLKLTLNFNLKETTLTISPKNRIDLLINQTVSLTAIGKLLFSWRTFTNRLKIFRNKRATRVKSDLIDFSMVKYFKV